MTETFRSNVLELEEWNLRSLRRIEARYDTLWLSNTAGNPVDESLLAEQLSQVSGKERIKALVIQATSKVKNLRFFQGLPRLEAVQAFGLELQTLDGLEWFQSGIFLGINTGRNKKRTIEKIAEAPIERLTLHWARPEDLEAIARSRTIRNLDLTNCPRLPLDRWQGVPIEAMGLWNGTVDSLADTRQLGLQKLTLNGCRQFERFEGDNGAITWAVIQDCNRLDWHSIKSLRNLVSLNVAGNKSDLPLSAFTEMGELQNLSLRQCKIQLDTMDLKSSSPKLAKLLIAGLNKDLAKELSRLNPEVLVSNGTGSFRNGTPV